MITNHTPQRSCITTNTVKRITTFVDNTEIIEEYDLKTELLVLRKIKRNRFTSTTWEYDVGFEPKKNELIKPNHDQPFLMRLDTKTEFCFRISKLPYPKEYYNVVVDGNTIKVTTSNKKYFTRLSISDMTRMNLDLYQDQVRFDYSNNTLLIKYKKPSSILELEEKARIERRSMGSKEQQESNCNQQ